MPFTLSHAAAALPFRKLKPIWPALVIGSFAPDLQYFIWISDEDRSGHHLPDVFLITLPLALVVLWLFEWMVKGPILELLSRGLQRRLQDKVKPLSFWGWRRFGSIILWITVGVATHLVWDQFTHPYSRLATHWSVLGTWVSVGFLRPMPLANILQHASTILGLVVLCVWCGAWYGRTAPAPRSQLREFSPLVKVAVVFTMIDIAILAGYAFAMSKLSSHEPPLSRQFVIATVFEATTLAFCIELLLYGAAMTVSARPRRTSAVEVNSKIASKS